MYLLLWAAGVTAGVGWTHGVRARDAETREVGPGQHRLEELICVVLPAWRLKEWNVTKRSKDFVDGTILVQNCFYVDVRHDQGVR